MEQLEKGDKNSKSLLTNVLDMDDDFIASFATENLVNMYQGGGGRPPWEEDLDYYGSLNRLGNLSTGSNEFRFVPQKYGSLDFNAYCKAAKMIHSRSCAMDGAISLCGSPPLSNCKYFLDWNNWISFR